MKGAPARSSQAVILTLVVTGILAMALGGYMTPVTRFLMNPVVVAQTWISSHYSAIQDFVNSPTDLARLRQENAELQAENANLKAQIIELENQNADMQVLSALLKFQKKNLSNEYLSASVIGRDTSPFLKYILIDRGSDDGLRRGMPVVNYQGLVGRVAAVSSSAARVQLITDPASKINVSLQSSGADAVLTGSLTGEVSLQMIPQDANVQPGDLVLTSGYGGSYPGNLLIGQVTSVHSRDYDLFQTASIQPVVDFSHLDIVMVIVNFNPVDITPLIPPSQP